MHPQSRQIRFKRTAALAAPLALIVMIIITAQALRLPHAAAQTTPIYPPDTQLTRQPMPANTPRPVYLKPVIDPVFKTKVTRIADQQAFGSNSKTLRHAYAKNQPWNADGSLLMLGQDYPAAILDGKTHTFLRSMHQLSYAVWSNVDPNKAFGTYAETNQFVAADMRKDRTYSIIQTFSEYDRIDFGAGEGNLSTNDRYVALFGIKGANAELVVYDIANKTVVSQLNLGSDIPGAGTSDIINNASMSQSGKYVVLAYNKSGQTHKGGFYVYDQALASGRWIADYGYKHYDLCYDTQGREVMVISNEDSPALIAIRLDTGERTTLLSKEQIGWDIHVSCRNTKRPGWAYISHFGNDAPEKPYFQEVFAVKLDGSGTVNRFAHSQHTTVDYYYNAPMAVPNHDGSKVLFASDWNDQNQPVYASIAEMPSSAPVSTATSVPLTTTPLPPTATPKPGVFLPMINKLTLFNAATDQPIGELKDGATLDLKKIGTTQLSVVATTNPAKVGSVTFALDGQVIQTENFAPYSVKGDAPKQGGRNYLPWTPTAGKHTLIVTPYNQAKGQGQAGTPMKVTFTVVN